MDMEWIRLTANKKAVMRLLRSDAEECPIIYPSHVFTTCGRRLEREGLVKGAWAEGRELEGARLTAERITYLALNPSLRNPVDWGKVRMVAALLSVMLAVAALLIACRL